MAAFFEKREPFWKPGAPRSLEQRSSLSNLADGLCVRRCLPASGRRLFTKGSQVNALSFPFLHGLRGVGPLLLRVTVGAIFLAHGWPKLSGGVSGFAPSVARLGIPAPTVVAWLVVLLEVVGGVMLIVGLLTRLVGLMAALEMLGTTLFVKAPRSGLIASPGTGCGAELDLALLVGALAVVFMGPGLFAVDQRTIERTIEGKQPPV